MKHAGVRLRTKLTTFSEEPTGMTFTFGSLAGTTPAAGVFDLTTGVFSGSADKAASSNLQTQTYDKTIAYDADYEDNFITLTAKDYITVPAGIKPEELVYNIAGGTLYKSTPNLTTPTPRKLKASGDFEANGSYTLTIKMMPKFIYLFEDGKTGSLSDAGRKDHVPIAVVFDSTGKRAVSLWDAKGGAKMLWTTYDPAGDFCNSSDNTMSSPGQGLVDPTSGKVWTWELYLCGYPGVTIPKADRPDFLGYQAAGKFYSATDLTSRLGTKTLASDLNKDGVWYLPSLYEWKEVTEKLGFGNTSSLNTHGTVTWKGNLVNYAFTAAKGTSIATNQTKEYQSATEQYPGAVNFVRVHRSNIYFSDYGEGMYTPYSVRPFVSY